MFNNGFPKEWSTLRKLAWLYRTVINAVSAVLKTVTGNPIHITDALAKPVQALSIALEPIQDLNGYDNPWPAGGGANKCDASLLVNDVGTTVTHNANGSIRIETSGSVHWATAHIPADNLTLAAGTYYIKFKIKSGANIGSYARCALRAGNAVKAWFGINAGTLTYAQSLTINDDCRFCFLLTNGSSTIDDACDFTVYDIMISSTDVPYAPYSNICPITGRSSVNVIISTSTNPLDGTITNIPLGQTVYYGVLDVVNGKLYLYPYYSSYNGETLVGEWISSMDKYEEGATPTTGAQVVDMGGTVTEISLTPEEITLLEGENNLWSDGTITMTYLADGNASDVEALNILLGGRYTNTHGEDEPTDREALDILLGGR